MNRSLHGWLILSILALLGSQAVAQITITATDIQSQFAKDSTKRFFDTTSTAHVNIGDTIGVTSWDFRTLRRDSSWSVLYVQPASTPYAANFTAANLAQKADITLNIAGFGVSAIGTAYEFYKLDGSFVDFGIKGSGTVGGLITGTVDWTKIPGDTVYKFPMTLGTRWTSSDSAITAIFVPNFYNSHTSKYESWDIVVDAYGPMTLPDSTIHDALRIRKTSRVPGTPVSYTFVSRDGAYVSLSAVDVSAPLTGTIPITKNTTWGPAVFTPATGISTTTEVPKAFSLEQNYPNPFNPATSIRYGLPQQMHVSLDVYNLIGQKVATLVNGNQSAGFHEVHFNGANLPSGVYFYRITADNYVKTLKMVLTK
jgi:hypothetical protein